MTKKQRKKFKGIPADQYVNLPTSERLGRGDIKVRRGCVKVEDPLRIDKLLANGIIDEMQHLYGMQIITLWNITCSPMLRSTRYDPSLIRGYRPDMTQLAIGRMSAEDQFYKTMSLLRKRPHDLIVKICFEEKAAIAAGKELGLPVNSITVYLREAFDALGDALAEMRRYRKEVKDAAMQREREDA